MLKKSAEVGKAARQRRVACRLWFGRLLLRRLRRRVTRSRSECKKIASRTIAAARFYLPNIDRKTLLLGTALASTLAAGCLSVPSAALAVPCSSAGPSPIFESSNTAPIVCVNTDTRIGGPYAIDLSTANDGNFIDLNNSGALQATGVGAYIFGIDARTTGAGSDIIIDNSGGIAVTTAGAGAFGFGIDAVAFGDGSGVTIDNSGGIAVTTSGAGAYAFGIDARTVAANGDIAIENRGDNITAATTGDLAFAFGIDARTSGAGGDIAIENSGDITATTAGARANVLGIYASTFGGDITIENSGDITATAAGTYAFAFGIDAITFGADSGIAIENGGDIVVPTTGINALAFGIEVRTYGTNSGITIENSRGITATTTNADAMVFGIDASTSGAYSRLAIENGGDIAVTSTDTYASTFGIDAHTSGVHSGIAIDHSGEITATTAGVKSYAVGIYASTSHAYSGIAIESSGGITATTASPYAKAYGIYARTRDTYSDITIENSGHIHAQSVHLSSAYGIAAKSDEGDIVIQNSGQITAESPGILGTASGIAADTVSGDITIRNSGDIVATGGFPLQHAIGISAASYVGDIAVFNSGAVTSSYYAIATHTYFGNTAIDNSGRLTASVDGIYATALQGNIAILNSGDIAADVHGIHAYVGCELFGPCYGTGNIAIANTAKIDAGVIGILAGGEAPHIAIENNTAVTAGYAGVFAFTGYDNAGIAITNAGKLSGGTVGILAATGVYDASCSCSNIPDLVPTGYGADSPISIVNSGSVYGGDAGIVARGTTGTTIVNSGTISSGTGLAIEVDSGPATIYNSGTITGYVLLDADDLFVNQTGGTFEARDTSDFDAFGAGGTDLFVNQEGATVHAVAENGTQPSFVNLERFENQGLISTVDGDVDDVFTIANTVGGTNLAFVASGHSTLAVDAFLGAPGSKADHFVIDGNVSGKTGLQVVNVNPGPGALNKQGIPVVFVNGNVKADAFFLPKPVDAGFFDYDLVFDPNSGGGGVFSLKSFLGEGAFVLPQLETAAQDLWSDSAETWFDRTADLRVLLSGGIAPAETGGKLDESEPASPQIAPAVWVRAAGSSLDRDASATVPALGNSYRFDFGRNLEAFNFEGGIDFGKRDLFAPGDILVFGLLGGGVAATLDYDKISRQFGLSGGEAGAYATYLKGGLFVDTLFKADLLTLDPKHEPGFPGSVSANTFGVRTDSGYRFGGFHGGPFVEPLATIAAIWADLDGFTQGGNSVSFNDDPNVRGRLGLRLGTDYHVWAGTTMEPFVIGSVWGNLSDNNQATLTSLGATFQLADKLQDVWGEVSGGANFFNPAANTSAFAKVDVSFGNDIDGISGKAGMRVTW